MVTTHLARFTNDITAFPLWLGFRLLLVFREILTITDNMTFYVIYLHPVSSFVAGYRGAECG